MAMLSYQEAHDKALADCLTWYRAEEARLLAEYRPVEPDAGLEPSATDWADYCTWCRELEAREQDLEDARRQAEWEEIMERASLFTDADARAAGLAVG